METKRYAIPDDELTIEAVRASGPGGQSVNKTSSKIRLRWHVRASRSLTDEQKDRVEKFLGKRLTASGELLVASDAERSQRQNLLAARRRLETLVASALVPPTLRRKTRATGASRRKKKEEKQRHSAKKTARRTDVGDGAAG